MSFYLSVCQSSRSISHVPHETRGLTEEALGSHRLCNTPGWRAGAQREVSERGKNPKASAARVCQTRWAARHHTRASQAIKRGPAVFSAGSLPPRQGRCWQYGTHTGEERRSATRNVGGPSEAAEEEEESKT